MISSLINISVPKMVTESKPMTHKVSFSNYTISDYVYSFLNGMHPIQKQRFKTMLENNIDCGRSIARTYNLNYNEFITEVKKQLEIN